MTYFPGNYVGPGDDAPDPLDQGGSGYDSGESYDATNPPVTVDTPDPFGEADDSSYDTEDDTGVDIAEKILPPWPLSRAPGTQQTIAPAPIIPVNPWAPVIALLNAKQVALLNRESAARQAAAQYIDNPHQI